MKLNTTIAHGFRELDDHTQFEGDRDLQPLPKLRLTIINRCQLKCVFCGGNDYSMENFQPKDLDSHFISKDDILYFIERYLAKGGKQIQFTGGEPLLRGDITDIIRRIRELGGIPEINTNGVALTKGKYPIARKPIAARFLYRLDTFPRKRGVECK